MAFRKCILPGSWAFGDQIVSLVKTSSRGLVGKDKQQAVKTAGAQFVHELQPLIDDLPPGDVLVHLTALGSTERTGPNRNGDGFRYGVCCKKASTFVTDARFYRDHLSKDKQRSYGVVKKAFVDPQTWRTELGVVLNGSPESARRHSGLVADRELQKLASGKDLPVSMGAQLSYDTCSYCHNEAKNRRDYCRGPEEGGSCAAGGLWSKMGQLVDISGQLHHLHADNDVGLRFNDISHVVRNADRIAYVNGVVAGLDKTASLLYPTSSAALAELWLPPEDQHLSTAAQALVQTKLAWLELLAAEECQPTAAELVKHAAREEAWRNVPAAPADTSAAELLKAANAQGLVLPLRVMLTAICGIDPQTAEYTAKHANLSHVFTQLLRDDNRENLLLQNDYAPAGEAPTAARRWAEKAAAYVGTSTPALQRRCLRAAAYPDAQPNKIATTGVVAAAADTVASEYASYVLSCLASQPQSRLTASLCVAQNRIS